MDVNSLFDVLSVFLILQTTVLNQLEFLICTLKKLLETKIVSHQIYVLLSSKHQDYIVDTNFVLTTLLKQTKCCIVFLGYHTS